MRLQQYINESTEQPPVLEMVQMLWDNCHPFIKDFKGPDKFIGLWSGRNDSRLFFRKSVRQDRYPIDTPYGLHQELDDRFRKEFGWKPRSQGLFCTGSIKTAYSYGSYAYGIFPIGQYKIIWSPTIKDLFVRFEGTEIYNYYKAGERIEVPDYIWSDQESEWTTYAGDLYEKEHPYPRDEDFEDKDDLDDAEGKWIEDRDDFIDRYIQDRSASFQEEYEQDIMERIEDDLSDVIRTYKSGDITTAIRSYNEIMVGTKEYLAIRDDLLTEHSLLGNFIRWHDWRKRPEAEHIIHFAQVRGYTSKFDLKILGVDL